MASQADRVVFEEWNSLSDQLRIPPQNSADIWGLIVLKYGEIHRFYHTLTHIYDMLKLVHCFTGQLKDIPAILLSVFFHDIIYDSTSNVNEQLSADLFVEHLEDLIDQSLCKKVVEYILVTKNHNVGNTTDTDLRYFVDIDLYILSIDRPLYLNYCSHIRQEYIHVPDEAYRTGRGAFLKSMLDKPFIFTILTDRDALARGNMEYEYNLLNGV